MLKDYQDSLRLSQYDFLPLMFRAKMICIDVDIYQKLIKLFPEENYIHNSYDRLVSLQINDNSSIISYIMAMLRNADTLNFTLISMCFPEIVSELKERYNSPGGIIELDNQKNLK